VGPHLGPIWAAEIGRRVVPAGVAGMWLGANQLDVETSGRPREADASNWASEWRQWSCKRAAHYKDQMLGQPETVSVGQR